MRLSRLTYTPVIDRLRVMRPRQWFKSVFVLAPYFFSGLWTAYALHALLAVLCFVLAASTVYIYNDLNDFGMDLRHPDKCHGPIASGRLSFNQAWRWMLVCHLSSLFVCYLLSRSAMIIVAAYMAINVLYTHRLKHIPYVDVFCISSGFMLRLLMGSIGIGISPSYDLICCGVALSIFLAMSKRYLEYAGLTGVQRDFRPVLQGYSLKGIISILLLAGTAFIISYLVFVIHKTHQHASGQWHWITASLVIIGVGRYSMCLYRNRSVLCPTALFIRDKCLVGLLAVTTVLLAKMI